MSAFLGPIHYWLFNKIVILESRAMAIAGALDKMGKASRVKEIMADYGDKLEGSDLAEIIGDNPIHQFLYGLIAKAQILESQLVEAADKDFDKILPVVEEHGKATAHNAISQNGGKEPANLEEIYQYIHNCQLEGMPCDPGASVNPVSGEHVRYTHSSCNHISNWRFTGVDANSMCVLTNTWLKSFVNGLNPKAEFALETSITGGGKSCSADIRMQS